MGTNIFTPSPRSTSVFAKNKQTRSAFLKLPAFLVRPSEAQAASESHPDTTTPGMAHEAIALWASAHYITERDRKPNLQFAVT